MTSLRVMHITYDMRIGGTEMVIKNIIEGNEDPSITMSIYCIEAPLGPWGELLKESGTPVQITERKDGFDTSLISSIRKHVKQNQIDVVHCHQYTPWVYGTLACLGLQTKVIFTEHGRFYPDFSSWKRRIINPILSFFTDCITAISSATKQALVDYEFISKRKIQVVHNGIHGLNKADELAADLKAQHNIPNDTFVVGTIARLDPIKNHLMMLRAIKQCIDKGLKIHFVLVGDGEMRSAIESEIEQLAISKHVSMTGYISEPHAFYSLFDLFLLTSFSEGMSMTLLEAMSVGLPCVVTDVGGNAEVVEHNVTGYVIPNDDTNALTEVISELYEYPERLHSLKEASILRFNSMFTSKIMLKRYQQCYLNNTLQ